MRLFATLAMLLLSVAGTRAGPELFEYETRQFGRWSVVCVNGSTKLKDCSAVLKLIDTEKQDAWVVAQARFIRGEPQLFFMVPPQRKASGKLSVRYDRSGGEIPLSCDERERECWSAYGIHKESLERLMRAPVVVLHVGVTDYSWGHELKLPTFGLKEALVDIVAKDKKFATR